MKLELCSIGILRILKKSTRSKRQGKVEAATRYEIKDDTNLVKTSMKKLLSHVETKKQLTPTWDDTLLRK